MINAKASYRFERAMELAQASNGISGRGPLAGKDAVYAGCELEPIPLRAPEL
jgi:hypothetical protein